MSPGLVPLQLAVTFAALTMLATVLTFYAVAWWGLRRRDGRAIRRLAELFVVFAVVFDLFWLVRLNTIVPLVPVRWSYALLQDWIWVLYLALALAVVRCRP
jgi:hypothetical protein